MILDQQLLLSDQQSLALAAGDHLSTNSIDLLATGTIPGIGGTPISDPGRGNPKTLRVQVTETFTSGGAATLTAKLVSGTGVDGTGKINAGKKVHNSTRAYALAELKAGRRLELAIPPGVDQRYLALEFTIGVAAMTAGKVTGGIVPSEDTANL